MAGTIEKTRYQGLVDKIQEKGQDRLITKYLEAKLETLKDRFLVEGADSLASLQAIAIEIELMIIDLKVYPVDLAIDDE